MLPTPGSDARSARLIQPTACACINARRARATAFPHIFAGREGGLSEPRARLVKPTALRGRRR